MKNLLCPSILSADFARLGEQVRIVADNGADYLHIDVMDGMFVPQISFGMPVIKSLRKVTDLFFDVHLMVVDPIRYIDDFAGCGADGITIHMEACDDPRAALEKIKKRGIKAGAAISPGTPVERFEEVYDLIDMALVMTVNPGLGGQKYIESSNPRIMQTRRLFKDKGIDMDIQVDGGITRDNIERVMSCGANVIVMGSSVFEGDVAGNTEYFARKMKG